MVEQNLVNDPNLISIEKAAELINKTPHSVRQLIHRQKILVQRIGRNIFVDLNSALTYHAVKKNLPSWEENIDLIQTKSFISVEETSSRLMVQPSYIIRLIREKILEGYVTAAGDIMVVPESINSYLRKPDVSTKEL